MEYEISFGYFLQQMGEHPLLLISVLLTLGVIFVNGWTDAPNAIATCVVTRCIGVRQAIIMAAICNFFGVLVMTMFNSKVAMTIKNMVNFNGNNQDAMIALCAAMAAIVIWAVGAWYFGIPTSESHALIAGLTGAAIALQGGMDGVNGAEWLKVIYGLVLSTIGGFVLGFVICKAMTNEPVSAGRPGGRWCGNGICTWRTGWSEVYGSPASGFVPDQWHGGYAGRGNPNLDDAALLCGDGCRHLCRW